MTITIKHLEGPLKGTEATFDDSYDVVVLGRDCEACESEQFTSGPRCRFQLSE